MATTSNYRLVNYDGSKEGIKSAISNSRIQEKFQKIAESNKWETQVDGNQETYILRTIKAGYRLHPERDKLAGCFVPKSFKIKNVISDDTPKTKEAASRLFKDIRFILRHAPSK